jgi:glycosyltransferase involved in cell wall biosynthesis
MGIAGRPDIRSAQLLHSRWPLTSFPRLHRRLLHKARAVYVRSHDLSLALGSLGIRHHLELHSLNPLIGSDQFERLIGYHQRQLIDRLIPISNNIARRLVEAGADAKRIHVAPSGVDLEAYRDLSPLDETRLSHPRIVYLGRISRDRGLNLLAHLAERALGEVHLIGEQEDEIPLALPNLHYRPTVPHREVPALYADCELTVMPYQPNLTHADGISPMKLFEAMAAGRVIIASDIPPIREIISHGVNGLLADPKEPLSWEHAVNRLSQEPGLAQRIARQAREDAQAYDWKERAKGIARAIGLATYQDLQPT